MLNVESKTINQFALVSKALMEILKLSVSELDADPMMNVAEMILLLLIPISGVISGRVLTALIARPVWVR